MKGNWYNLSPSLLSSLKHVIVLVSLIYICGMWILRGCSKTWLGTIQMQEDSMKMESWSLQEARVEFYLYHFSFCQSFPSASICHPILNHLFITTGQQEYFLNDLGRWNIIRKMESAVEFVLFLGSQKRQSERGSFKGTTWNSLEMFSFCCC